MRVLGMLSSSFWLGNIGCKYLNASLCMSPDSASAGLMFNLCSGFLLQRLSDSLLSELFILCEAILAQPYSLTANQSILTARWVFLCLSWCYSCIQGWWLWYVLQNRRAKFSFLLVDDWKLLCITYDCTWKQIQL